MIKVAIIGAGVNGLGIGWRLAQSGCIVDIFDRGEAGRGASWAAAGMLAAASEVEPQEEGVLKLHLHSQRLWPAFTKELEASSGIGIDYRSEGTLILATGDEVDRLRFRYEHMRALDLDVEWLSANAARDAEPALGPTLRGAISAPQDHQVDNRKVTMALHKAALTAGARLHEHSEVTLDSGKVIVHGKIHDADIVILAAGAWAGELADVPVRPVKGQAISLQAAPYFLSHVIWTRGAYIVPRRDGRLIIGATVEEKGFDDSITAGGMLTLLHSAWHALPDIQELPILETWAGFRPGSPDDAPILGYGPANIVYCCGHNRNGIMLLPAMIEAISQLVLSGSLPDLAASFTMDRFIKERNHVAVPA